MNQNRILITGRSGFLGGILYEGIKKNGMEVVDLQELFPYRVDIRDQFYFDEEVIVQTVIHAAGKAHYIPKSEFDAKEFDNINLYGTINLCNAIDKCKYTPRSFIFISTVAVYGKDSGNYLNENEPLLGSSAYARSKIKAEEYLRSWAANRGITLSILRLPLVAGKNPPGNLKLIIDGIKRNRYFSIGNADNRKSIIWGEDILNILPFLEQLGGIYNLTDGHNPTFKELENRIADVLGKGQIREVPYWVARCLAIVGDLFGSNRFVFNSQKLRKITSTLTFDDQKARDLLNWSPSSVLDKVDCML